MRETPTHFYASYDWFCGQHKYQELLTYSYQIVKQIAMTAIHLSYKITVKNDENIYISV
jgi:hypothetical protein